MYMYTCMYLYCMYVCMYICMYMYCVRQPRGLVECVSDGELLMRRERSWRTVLSSLREQLWPHLWFPVRCQNTVRHTALSRSTPYINIKSVRPLYPYIVPRTTLPPVKSSPQPSSCPPCRPPRPRPSFFPCALDLQLGRTPRAP